MKFNLEGPEGLLLLLTRIVARTLEASERGELPPPPAGVVGTREEIENTLVELSEEVAVGARVLLQNGELFAVDRAALEQWLDSYVAKQKEKP